MPLFQFFFNDFSIHIKEQTNCKLRKVYFKLTSTIIRNKSLSEREAVR